VRWLQLSAALLFCLSALLLLCCVQVSSATRIEVVTEGILLRRLQQDPTLQVKTLQGGTGGGEGGGATGKRGGSQAGWEADAGDKHWMSWHGDGRTTCSQPLLAYPGHRLCHKCLVSAPLSPHTHVGCVLCVAGRVS
jgi:hypothetical protein